MNATLARDRNSRTVAVVCATILLAVLLTLAQPGADALAASPKSAACVGTAMPSVLTFTVAKTYREFGTKVYRSGGAKTYGDRSKSAGKTTTHKVNVVYCKAKGTSTWKLWSWYTTPVYGSATVTIKNDKIVNADGPLTLVKGVGTGKFLGVTRQYLDVRPFNCVDGKLTKSMKAQKIAKFVTGLPIPQSTWVGLGTWGVNKAIPDVTTPRECAYTGVEKLAFSPNSKGVAVWAPNMKTSGQSAVLFLRHGEIQSAWDRSWTEYWTQSVTWRIIGK